jgi:hypothetical protein
MLVLFDNFVPVIHEGKILNNLDFGNSCEFSWWLVSSWLFNFDCPDFQPNTELSFL